MGEEEKVTVHLTKVVSHNQTNLSLKRRARQDYVTLSRDAAAVSFAKVQWLISQRYCAVNVVKIMYSSMEDQRFVYADIDPQNYVPRCFLTVVRKC